MFCLKLSSGKNRTDVLTNPLYKHNLDFFCTENIIGTDPTEMMTVPPWSIKVAKICQPNLDYLGKYSL